MTTYNSYEAAKIANPESDIWASKLARCGRDNIFGTKVSLEELTNNYFKCNPADHCMTVEKFLDDGRKGVNGDVYLDDEGALMVLGVHVPAGVFNEKERLDFKRYILSAEALETKEPKRTKVEYVKVEDSIFDLRSSLESGELYYKDIDDKFYEISGESQLVNCFDSSCVYRRIETEITERDEFIDEMPKPDFEAWFWELDSVDRDGEYRLGVKGRLTTLFNDQLKVIYDSGKFKLVTSD